MHFLCPLFVFAVICTVYAAACHGSQAHKRGLNKGYNGNGNGNANDPRSDAIKKAQLDDFNADLQLMKADAVLLNRKDFLAKFKITEEKLAEYEDIAAKEKQQDFLDILAKVNAN